MKKVYWRFRILLMTLALGLASVGFFNLLIECFDEISVDLPVVEASSPIVVFPRKFKEMPYAGGSPCCDSNGYTAENFGTHQKSQE